MNISEALASAGLTLKPIFNGEKIREKSQWFWGYERFHNGKLYQYASFGDFKTMGKDALHWKSWEEKDLSKTDQKDFKKYHKEQLEKKNAAQKESHERARQRCNEELTRLSPVNFEIYLRRKSLSVDFGAKVSVAPTSFVSSEVPHLAVPLYDLDKTVWNLQHIYHDGGKTFEKGARKQGLFYLLSTTHHTWFDAAPEAILIAEGYATACSLQEALGPETFIVCAFDSGNMPTVAKALRDKYQEALIILCADNDIFTQVNGKYINPGRLSAEKAYQEIGKPANIVYPQFLESELSSKPTDFNDLHSLRGVGAVRERVEELLKEPATVSGEISQLTLDGNKIPKEKEVIDHLKKFYGDSLCQQNKCYFQYRENHWVELDDDNNVKIKQQIYYVSHYKIHGWQVEQFFKTFLNELPINYGPNFFEPTRLKTNFTNGVLELARKAQGKYELSFHPNHRHEDNLTSVIPHDLPSMDCVREGAEVMPAPKFEKLLTDIYDVNDPEFLVRRRLILQLMGAALIPEFAKIVFFIGPPGTGKSTILLLIVGLIGVKNCSRILPSKLEGSNLATLVGKLINFHTDIDTHAKMKDAVLKCLIDGEATSIERKYKKNVDAFIPKYHLYAGNDLPKTLETAAYARRAIIMRTDKWRVPADYIHNFEQVVLEEEREALLQRALIGLQDLVQSGGHYIKLEDSIKQVVEMQKEHDYIQQFLDDVKSGEFIMLNKSNADDVSVGNGPPFFGRGSRIILGEDIPTRRVSSRVVWSQFSEWFSEYHAEGSGNRAGVSKSHFKRALVSKGFLYGESNGTCYFKGFVVAE